MRRKRLLVERDVLPLPNIEQLSHLNLEAEGNAVNLEQKQESLAHSEDLLLEAEEVKERVREQGADAAAAVIQAEARLGALQRLQHRLEGSERLSAWLIKHHLDTLPRLWQYIQIEKGWEDALEAVLRERLNSVQLDQLESMHDWTNDPPPAKWAAYEATSQQAQGEQTQEPLHEPLYEPAHDNQHWTLLQSYVSCDDSSIKGLWKNGLVAFSWLSSLRESVSSPDQSFHRRNAGDS